MTALGNLWRDTAAETAGAPLFRGDRRADLAIIGAGFTGCSAALEAAGQGADVVVLEAETIGHGGSGRNVGLVNAGLWLPPDTVCAQLGEAQGERLNSALAGAPDLVFDLIERHRIDCEATRNGTLHLAHAPKAVDHLKDRHGQMTGRGAPVTLLSAAETRERTGTTAFHGALHDARAGTLQPLAYARGLARAAGEAGAHFFQNSPVQSAEHTGGQWILRTASGKLYCKALLVATNAYHQPIAPVSVPPVPVVHYFQLATEPLRCDLAGDILPGQEGCWDTALVMTSVRRDAVGRLIIGGIGDGSSMHHGWARRKLTRLYPKLAGIAITHAWEGRISMTSDHLPRILKPAPERAYAIFGYSGRGIGPGTLFGRAAAQALLTGDETGLPVMPVAQFSEAFPCLKSVYYETGARVVHALSARGK